MIPIVRDHRACRTRAAVIGSARGFTLIEVIIAITILSLVTVIIGSAFRLGIQAWEKGEKETGDTQRLRIMSGMLSQQLKSAFPYKVKIEDEDEPVVIFKGETDSLLFVTTFADSSYGGFKWVKYVYKDGDLYYKEGLLPDKKIEEKVKDKEEIIDTDVSEVRFEYLSPEDGEWVESWDYGQELPEAVKIKISYFQPFIINVPMSWAILDDQGVDERDEPL